LVAYAEREEVDLIAIGARGTRSQMRPPFGSTVDHVLRRSRCPVLVARTRSLQCVSDFDCRGNAPD
jgi:nucleotide-binding universal stress UspA family protein